MLVSARKVLKNETEWEKFDNQATIHSIFNEKKTTEFSSADTSILEEYNKLSTIISSEYLHQMEIISKLQKSYFEIIYNNLGTSYNFFQLCSEQNFRIINHFFKK